MRTRLLLLLATLLFLASPARAQGPVINQSTCTVSWTAPTTNADGTPLTDLAAYRIYEGTGGLPVVTVLSPTTTPAPATTVTAPCGSWAVGPHSITISAADVIGNESVRTSAFPFVLRDDVSPSAPSNVRMP